MRYITLILGMLSIFIVSILHFYPEEVEDYVEEKILKKEYIIAKPNDYYLDGNFKYIENYTDDVSNKKELLDYIYYVINTGSEYADGECTKEYTNCITDLKNIADDQDTLTIINNFVHPYNSFKTISFTYDTKGHFSLSIEHVYTKEEISEINYVIDNQIKTLAPDSIPTEDKIKNIHNL